MIPTFFTSLLIGSVALATSTAESTLPLAPIVEAGFVMLVADHDGRFSAKPPTGWIENDTIRENFHLADDGRPPDLTANDGVYAVLVKDTPRGQVELALLSDGIEIWKDTVPVGQTMRNPLAELNLRNGNIRVNFSTFDRSEDADQNPQSPSTIPRASVIPAGTVSVGKMQTTGLLLAGLTGLIGLGLGVAVGISLGRRKRPISQVNPIAPPPEPDLPSGLPSVRSAAQVWSVDSQSSLIPATRWLVSALAHTGPVLLLPGKGQRAAMGGVLREVVGVSWLDIEHPSPDEVLDVCEILERVGRPTIVVQGVLALEAAAEDEAPDAVLHELLDLSEHLADVIAIVVRGETTTIQITADLQPFLPPVPAEKAQG